MSGIVDTQGNERQLHCFESETDHVIAFDEEDAFKVIAEVYGEADEKEWREQAVRGEWEWEKCEPGAKLKFDERSDDYAGEEHTIAEWIAIEGRGLLCSTEW